MEINYYCYTRGSEMDYDIFSVPNNVPERILDIISSKQMAILGDGVERNLKVPKWLLYKDRNWIFWGVCCENKLLAEENQLTSHKNRPIRGFFAMVINNIDQEVKLPFDINYFRELYKNEVVAYWNQWEPHFNKTSGYIPGQFNYVIAQKNDYAGLLNVDRFECRSLGEVDKERVIAAALTMEQVSLLIDNDNIEQAINQKGAFMNCLTKFVPTGIFPVKQLCPQCKEYVSAFTNAGVCPICEMKSQTKFVRIEQKEKKDEQMKKELEQANSRIQYLQYDIEKMRKRLKRKELFIRILLIISVMLLLALSYTWRDTLPLRLFHAKRVIEMNNPKLKESSDETPMEMQSSFIFKQSVILVGAKGEEGRAVDYITDLSTVDFTTSEDWVKLEDRKTYLELQIDSNSLGIMREAVITATYDGQKTTLIVIQDSRQ